MPFDLAAEDEDPFAVIINGETLPIPEPTSAAIRRYSRDMRHALQVALDAQTQIEALPDVTPEEEKERTARIDKLTEAAEVKSEKMAADAIERLTQGVITADTFLALARVRQIGLAGYIRERISPEVSAPATTPTSG